jgi:choline dehydrogenase
MASESFDVLILGGGTAGCVLADRLSEDASRRVGLVEAGPDYGHREERRWPEDMADARTLATSHDWGFEEPGAGRARIVGGCSAHNACLVVWGSVADYDEWSPLTGGAWDFAGLEPYLRRGQERLRTRAHTDEELSAWDRAFLDACDEAGFASLDDINDPGKGEGAGTFPINASGSVRWNTSFAYLDPARARDNLTVLPGTLIDRVEVRGDRVTGARVIRGGRAEVLRADSFALAAGSYGSPAVLLRSGIGPPGVLGELDIPVALSLGGVGEGLTDHYGSYLEFRPTEDLLAETTKQLSRGLLYQTTSVLKARTSTSPDGSWDLHVLAWTDTVEEPRTSSGPGFHHYLSVKMLKPRSRGVVRLHSSDPAALPAIHQGFLSAHEDIHTLTEGLRLVARLARTESIGRVVSETIGPGEGASDEDLAAYGRETAAGYFHPVGTCRMAPEDDPSAVVDASARVHGLANLFVVDASIIPTIPRANTNLTVVAVAERLAEGILAES